MADDRLTTWEGRREAARRDRRQYERQWQVSQHFAAGVQWLKRDRRNGRVLPVFSDDSGKPYQTADVLDQYVKTAIGKIAGDDFRPELLALHDDAMSEQYAADMNDSWEWGWENEWRGDRKALGLLRILAVFGTGGIRVRYDRTKGPLLASEIPHEAGRPILDPEQARAFVANQQTYGLNADLRELHEGRIVWELLSPWNLLPEPGIDDPADFAWEIVCRPVELSVLQAMYPGKADGLQAEPIDSAGMLGLDAARGQDALSPAGVGKLENHVLVYTGYQRPCPDYKQGETFVFAAGRKLASEPRLPLSDDPYGPRSGVTCFRWSIVPGRFWGKGFIEPGIGPQIARNKRLTQADGIIDHGLPARYYAEGSIDPEQLKGRPDEWVPVKQGFQPPQTDQGIPVGPWLINDIELQDANVEKALGLHDVTLGKSSSATAPYARLAYEGQNDVVKLGPIAKDFKLGIADAGRDTFECMRQWPPGKRMLLHSQDPQGHLRMLVFDATKLPTAYIVRPASGEALPRGQAALLQKTSDLFTAALQTGAVLRDPDGWLEWFAESLDAGQPGPLPSSDARTRQRKQAELENQVMAQTGQPAIVQPYQDHVLHIQIHDDAKGALDQQIMLGDPQAAQLWQALDVHNQWHAEQAQAAAQQQATAMQAQAGLVQGTAAAPPNGPAGVGSQDLMRLFDFNRLGRLGRQ